MNDQDKPPEQNTGHEYDGIQELDNPLPRWWVGSFVATVLFGVPYFLYYVLGSGPTLLEEHQAHMKVINEKRALAQSTAAEFDQVTFEKMVATDGVSKGIQVFEANCVACHKEKGVGDIGPNLTDPYWIHGKGTPAEMYKVVFHGVEDKGMPVWKEILTQEEVYQAVVYVHTLRNKNLKGKEPQGEKVQD